MKDGCSNPFCALRLHKKACSYRNPGLETTHAVSNEGCKYSEELEGTVLKQFFFHFQIKISQQDMLGWDCTCERCYHLHSWNVKLAIKSTISDVTKTRPVKHWNEGAWTSAVDLAGAVPSYLSQGRTASNQLKLFTPYNRCQDLTIIDFVHKLKKDKETPHIHNHKSESSWTQFAQSKAKNIILLNQGPK